MEYKLKENFSKDPKQAIIDILKDRGVKDPSSYVKPSAQCENNPYDLENIEAAADLLIKHIQKKSKICIVVDCDDDGYCSSAILWNYLKRFDNTINLDFVVHEGKGHGLSDIIEQVSGGKFDLVVLPDAGSYDIRYFWILNKCNTDVIALDHHEQMYDTKGAPIVNDCPTAIVVNNQLSPKYANKDFCGAGVTYRFCNVLDDKLGVSYSKDYIDLAAVGNIGDVMFQGDPETRYIIVEGLKHIKNGGLQELIAEQAFSLKERANPPYSLTPIDVAFYIVPLVNAIVRVGSMEEKRVLFYALTDPDKQLQSTKRGAKPGDIETAAEQAARTAKNVKARQDRIKEKAIETIVGKIENKGLDKNNLIIVEISKSDDIPNEMTGLIAQNIVTKYNKPCFIVRRDNDGILRGSLRNNGNFKDLPQLKPVLEQTHLFSLIAGHANAAGIGIAASKVPALLEYMNKSFAPDAFDNCYLVDYIFKADEDINDLLYALASHADYYGNGVTEPTFVVEKIPLKNATLFPMGTNKDSLRITYNGIDYIRFKDAEFVEKIMNSQNKLLTIYFKANINNWGGRTTVQGFINDYELGYDKSRYEF
ncbi:MAG: hypothetical protein J6N95_07535 [Bacilli bacterium]|nr:hypothetical protein [Bacilli bacterium]